MSAVRRLARLARRGIIEVDAAQDVRELALFGAYPEEVITRGAVTRTDGGGARWRWNETSEAVDAGDPAPTLMPVGHTGAGRFEMVVEGDVFVECFGLPTVASGDNAAQAWTDANLYAWRNGHRRVTLKSRRDGMQLWGVIPCSRVTDDLKGSIIEPYAPPVPEGTAGYHQLTIFAHGAAVRVPEAFVGRYNLRSWDNVNAMIDDPDMSIDHRHLHPDGAVQNPGVTWIEFKAGKVFDPRGRVVQTDGVSTFEPGQLVVLFRPYYETAVDQSGAAFGIVSHVDGEYVHFRDQILFPFARHHCRPNSVTTQTVWGGIASVPDNFALIDSHVTDFELDGSGVDPTKHSIHVWRAGQSVGCSCTNFKIYGGEYWYAFGPKGRGNYVGGLRRSGDRSSIMGRGSFIANDQFCQANTFEHLNVALRDWVTVYPGYSHATVTGHYAERSSVKLRHMAFMGAPFDANTPDFDGADLTTGSVGNEIIDVEFRDVRDSLAQITQIDGYGELVCRDVRYTGGLQGPYYSVGRADNLNSGMPSKQMAFIADGLHFNVVQRPAALTNCDPLMGPAVTVSTDAAISNSTLIAVDGDTGEELPLGTYTGYSSISFPGAPNEDIAPENLEYISPRLRFANNAGVPELRWRRFGVADLITDGTRDVANGYILLPADANTYFRFSLREPDLGGVVLFYVLRLADPAGAGGTSYFQGTLFCTTPADPESAILLSSKPASTEVTLAAVTSDQRICLPIVRNATDGLLPGDVSLWRRANLGTAGALRLRGVDVLMVSGR